MQGARGSPPPRSLQETRAQGSAPLLVRVSVLEPPMVRAALVLMAVWARAVQMAVLVGRVLVLARARALALALELVRLRVVPTPSRTTSPKVLRSLRGVCFPGV